MTPEQSLKFLGLYEKATQENRCLSSCFRNPLHHHHHESSNHFFPRWPSHSPPSCQLRRYFSSLHTKYHSRTAPTPINCTNKTFNLVTDGLADSHSTLPGNLFATEARNCAIVNSKFITSIRKYTIFLVEIQTIARKRSYCKDMFNRNYSMLWSC